MRNLLLLLGICLLLISCEQIAWYRAEQDDTLVAYEAYLVANPTGTHADSARARVERFHYIEAESVKTLAAYQEFITTHPSGPYSDQVKAAIERIYYQQAEATNTIAAYQDFLDRYPSGRYSENARTKMDGLRIWQITNAKATNINGFFECDEKFFPFVEGDHSYKIYPGSGEKLLKVNFTITAVIPDPDAKAKHAAISTETDQLLRTYKGYEYRYFLQFEKLGLPKAKIEVLTNRYRLFNLKDLTLNNPSDNQTFAPIWLDFPKARVSCFPFPNELVVSSHPYEPEYWHGTTRYPQGFFGLLLTEAPVELSVIFAVPSVVKAEGLVISYETNFQAVIAGN